MIPHIMTGIIYTIEVRLECSKASHIELHELSTFDTFKDAYGWIENDEFSYTVIHKDRKGNHFHLTVYLRLDEEKSLSDIRIMVRDIVKEELCSKHRGIKILHLGRPTIFLRLNSVECRIAQHEELRTEKIFNELIDS